MLLHNNLYKYYKFIFLAAYKTLNSHVSVLKPLLLDCKNDSYLSLLTFIYFIEADTS